MVYNIIWCKGLCFVLFNIGSLFHSTLPQHDHKTLFCIAQQCWPAPDHCEDIRAVPQELTVWTLHIVLTRISLSMPRRLTRTDTFYLLWIFCFWNNYSIHWDGMCWPRLACAGWSGSIHYADAIMLVFMWNSSFVIYLHIFWCKLMQNARLQYIMTD